MNGTAHGSDLPLTSDQEDLLRTALSSNPPSSPKTSNIKRTAGAGSATRTSPTQRDNVMANGNGTNVTASPVEDTPGSALFGNGGSDESPFLDYELEDGNFEWDNNGDQLFGDLPEYPENGEHHDKRKASTDDDDEEEGSSKRREGDDRSTKKLGRKPLTAEPTSKRKAQNRAAQRAFRERKERHLKDLETKVDDLEKASETTNHENGKLRAQVERLNMELKEYRKRLSMTAAGVSQSPPLPATQNQSHYTGNGNGDDFRFTFPKFGDLPGSFMSNGSMAKTSSPTKIGQRPASSSNPSVPGLIRKESSASTTASSPTTTNSAVAPSSDTGSSQTSMNGFKPSVWSSNFDGLAGLFSPSILETASHGSSGGYMPLNDGNIATNNANQGSMSNANGQTHKPIVQHGSSTSITASPASSMSQIGLNSSCGTTPEASMDSPDNRKASEGTLITINEESNSLNKPGVFTSIMKSPVSEINGIDWMVRQNGGQFDPVLFGDYRDTQDNILNNNFGDFFNDALPLQDFGSPYNTGEVSNVPPKRDLMKEIEVTQNGGPEEIAPAEAKMLFLNCDQLWDHLRTSEKVQRGEVDMDDLCAQLKSKAKCSGSGAQIEQAELDRLLSSSARGQTDSHDMLL